MMSDDDGEEDILDRLKSDLKEFEKERMELSI